MPLDRSIKKVLVIGSGPIVIGQAAEFDYAGAQACRILKEAGVNVVLLNSNPATIMTDKAFADEIYLEPLTVKSLKRIIEKEKPDSILAGLGGQTGLTLAMQLNKEGYFEKNNIRLIGTNAEAIDKAEDRDLFKKTMEQIGEPTIPSDIANDVPEALEIAEKIGYPVIIRPAFTLGGGGGGVANNAGEMKKAAKIGLDASPITQILVEKYIYGWKEIEFETMRDSAGNVIAVCSMENLDPVGVHTGDSIVVAPALTLSDKEYQMLRTASLNIITALDIVGGCNCQFALNPNSFEYSVIEVNPRVSRSSALASKATGYPIAKITTKIALGYTLDEIENDITKKTCACFEPALDYVVVKFPKWPFDKFFGSSRKLGTQMKATGEVMSIGENFPAALMKAVRGAEISLDTLNAKPLSDLPVLERLKECDDRRIFTVFEAIKNGISIDEIFNITKIDKWFLNQIKRLADYENEISKNFSDELYYKGKKLGYTDESIKRISGKESLPGLDFSYKMVDTCGAEFNSETPYFYSTTDKYCESRTLKRSGHKTVIVLGSGPIRIGQGIEFDYSSVHCVRTLKEMGYDVVIINNNPETVSTDYDTAHRLYFEPLCEEDVMNIIKVEKPLGVVVAFGGQTAIKLTKFLDNSGIKILGTSAESIDIAEDRDRFDSLLEKFNISRPKGSGVTTIKEAVKTANSLGYPVLLRPSYVIGGQNMRIVRNDEEVKMYMDKILAKSVDNPVLVDKYMMGTELEVDVISDGENILIPGIMEHIERAGVHSGDSIAVYPPYNLNDIMTEKIIDCTKKLALSLNTKGLLNIQYLIYHNELYVIEVNPRASRTIPYISKVTGVPMVDIATRVMLGEKIKDMEYGTGLFKIPPYVAVKVPVFSFEKLTDVNSYLGPEMKSTGEVLGIGKNIKEALYKGLLSAGMIVDSTRRGGVFISVDAYDLEEVISLSKKFQDLNYRIYATEETAETILKLGIEVTKVKDDVYNLIEDGKIDYIVYTGALMDSTVEEYIALKKFALNFSVPCFTSLDTANALADILSEKYTEDNLELVDINHMRKKKKTLQFYKMQGTGDDYIFVNNFSNEIDCPESLCVELCSRHRGIGGYGIVLMEKSKNYDCRMKLYNRDGSLGAIGGNSVRCVAKYLYDNKIVKKKDMKIETEDKVVSVHVYTNYDKVTMATVDMGHPEYKTEKIPVNLPADKIINYPVSIDGKEYKITCLSMGNPHCVLFVDKLEEFDVKNIGSLFESADIFPDRVNTEFVKVVDSRMIKMRVFERGNGETYACGSGACAAVCAAVENGMCDKNKDITVKVRGGDLIVRYDDNGVFLTGNAELVYEGKTEY